MKRFIIISLLTVIALPLFACAGIETHNHYLFHVYDEAEFRYRVDRTTLNNWKAYLGIDSTDYYWFNAEEVIEAAKSKGDALMVSYVNHLVTYLDCASEVDDENWEYPTKEELEARRQKLLVVRQYALSKVKSRLRSQHALLYMRCNMLLGRHDENVQFWQQTASKFIDTVYRDMMMNIYAGALTKTGHVEMGAEIFAQQGDYQSLMTIYYKRRSFEAIRQVYEKNPNHAALPFLLQDFVNNAQEAYDREHDNDWPGKLFIRDIERDEAMKMAAFAAQVANEGRSETSAMWMTAAAWLNYLFGDAQKAVRYAAASRDAVGTALMKDCARIIQFYIRGVVEAPSTALDKAMAVELRWLNEKAQAGTVAEEPYYECDYFYYHALDRIVHQVLADKYAAQGRTSTALALYRLADSYHYDAALDTMCVDDALRFYAYVKSPQADNSLDGFLKSHLEANENTLIDLIGIKYLRLAQWAEGIKWLDRVPLDFYNEQGYAVYANFRKADVEPWIKRQWLDNDAPTGDIHLSVNPRKAIASEILQLEQGLNLLKGKARLQRCYDLAVRYAQIHVSGDCWFVLRNGKSNTYDYEPELFKQPHEVDFAAKAVEMLRQASTSDDFYLKERALFALSYVYLNPDCWYDSHWDSELDDYRWTPVPDRQQYKHFADLLRFENSNPGKTSNYVSRCDQYIQFKKHFR